MSWIDRQLRARDITDARVIEAMARVRRDAFVPQEYADEAYADSPLPIGFGQTISQPYVVAWMTQALDVQPGLRVLEVGTGSGYQTAILAELGGRVWSVEIVPELATRARAALEAQGYGHVQLRVGSGYEGWPEAAPFDRIILTAAPPEIPQPLVDQLADAGRLIAPVGTSDLQVLVVMERSGDRVTRRDAIPVRFVPMVRGVSAN
jgi:protein-L-isoaspartate(D-aspartate) O-methyltransferase